MKSCCCGFLNFIIKLACCPFVTMWKLLYCFFCCKCYKRKAYKNEEQQTDFDIQPLIKAFPTANSETEGTPKKSSIEPSIENTTTPVIEHKCQSFNVITPSSIFTRNGNNEIVPELNNFKKKPTHQ